MPIVLFCTPSQAKVDTSAPVLAIRVGKLGYYPLERIHAHPDDLNPSGTTPAIIESAIAGSLFGWDCQAAQALSEKLALAAKTAMLIDTEGDK